MKRLKTATWLCVLAIPPLAAGCEGAIVERHGLTLSELQQEEDYWGGEMGLKVSHTSAYNVGGEPLFAAIWEAKEAGELERVARHNLTPSLYEAYRSEYALLGYRPVAVDGYEGEDGSARYTAIWAPNDGTPFVAKLGLTSTQYQAEHDRWVGREGYRPTWLQGYAVDGQRYFAAMWEKRSGPAYQVERNMTYSTFYQRYSELWGQGYRPVHVSGYNAGGVAYYAAVWEQFSDTKRRVTRNRLTSEEFRQRYVDFHLRGYHLDQVDGYELNGDDRYAALWTTEDSASTGDYCNNGYCFSMDSLVSELENNLTKEGNVVKYAYEVRKGLSVMQGADGPARTEYSPPARDFTVHDRFDPASVTKFITAVAVAKLAEAKGVPLTAPVYRYLPPHWNVPLRNQSITIEQVLLHTSGLTGNGHRTYAQLQQAMETEVASGTPSPGYQGINYALLRLVVASLDGMTDWTTDPTGDSAERFISYLNKEIFEPAGIYDVKFNKTGDDYVLFYPDPPEDDPGITYGDYSLKPGAAGVFLSTHELALLIDAVFNPRANGQILSTQAAATLRAMGGDAFSDWTLPDGSKCWGKGGYYPGSSYGERQLSTHVISCDNGFAAMVSLNGFTSSTRALKNALVDAYTPAP